MLDRDSQGIWRKSMQFSVGAVHEYKFVINENEWALDGSKPTAKDKHGNVNNLLKLEQSTIPRMPNLFDQFEKQYADIRVPRTILNNIHYFCNQHNAEIFMHTQTPDTIVVVRQFELDLDNDFDAFTTINRFCYSDGPSIKTTVDLPGFIQEIVFAATINDAAKPLPEGASLAAETEISTPPSQVTVSASLTKYANVIYDADSKGTHSQLAFFNLPTSFVCLVKTVTVSRHKLAVFKLNKIKSTPSRTLASELFDTTNIAELNHLLFRCCQEENDITPSDPRGPYGLKSG